MEEASRVCFGTAFVFSADSPITWPLPPLKLWPKVSIKRMRVFLTLAFNISPAAL